MYIYICKHAYVKCICIHTCVHIHIHMWVQTASSRSARVVCRLGHVVAGTNVPKPARARGRQPKQ